MLVLFLGVTTCYYKCNIQVHGVNGSFKMLGGGGGGVFMG